MLAQLDQGGAIRKVQPCVDLTREDSFLFGTGLWDERSVTFIRIWHDRVTGAMSVSQAQHKNRFLEGVGRKSVGFFIPKNMGEYIFRT